MGKWLGMEVEYQGKISTPMTTAAALGYIYLFNLKDTELYKKTISYLKNTQNKDGSWDDCDAILMYKLPPYMGPAKYVDYKTGMIVKWLLRLNSTEKKMISKAINYLSEDFSKKQVSSDFWSAVAYMNAFREITDHPKKSEILKWAGGVLQKMMKKQNSNASSWFLTQGMIIDDDPQLNNMFDTTFNLIKENQLPNGAWPNQFGTYNQVWASIMIIRFLKNNHPKSI